MRILAVSRRLHALALAAGLGLAFVAGCSQSGSGDPKDFGPVDTSHALKSEDIKAVAPKDQSQAARQGTRPAAP